MFRKLQSMIWRVICLAWPLLPYYIASAWILMYCCSWQSMERRKLSISLKQRTSGLFSVTPDTKSLSKFIPCSRPMEGLMLISACPLITVSLQLLRCIYVYIYIAKVNVLRVSLCVCRKPTDSGRDGREHAEGRWNEHVPVCEILRNARGPAWKALQRHQPGVQSHEAGEHRQAAQCGKGPCGAGVCLQLPLSPVALQ